MMYNLILKAMRLMDKIYLKEIKFEVFKFLTDIWYPVGIIWRCWEKCVTVQNQVTPQEDTMILEEVIRNK